MLKVNNLSKSYGGQVLFDEVSFMLGPGERVGLVGRNGQGKTTLFKMILGLEEPDSGEISLPRHYRTGHLSQHLHFTEDTVLQEACLGLPANEDGIDETYKAEMILSGLGVGPEYFDLKPSELSGGYQIRLNLAKVLISEPNLLLLDEPTNYLDIVSVRWLKRFLGSWNGELMVITHDRDFMDSITTHTMAIHRQKVRKIQGPTEKLYSQILLEEEVYEQTRQNDEKKRKETEKFINRFRASATKASAVQSRIKALGRKERLEELREIKTLDFEFNSAPFTGKFLMEVKDLSFGYGSEAGLLIKDLSFAVGKEDRIGIVGKNGKGKTTLLNLLGGEIKPLAGTVAAHQNARLACFGQTNIERLERSKTVEEEMMAAHPEKSRAAARRVCGSMMFEGDSALKKIEVLSGGERSRVLLGKLILSPSNMLLLDEPTNHLDMESIDSLVEAIDAFSGACVIVTHSELILNAVATRLIIFDSGEVRLFDGTYGEFLDKVGWESEAAEDALKALKKKGKEGSNRKETRKKRAEVVSEKGRTIGPIQKRMYEVEGLITALEKESEEAGRALLAASEGGDAQAITAHSRSYHGSRERIDALFDELEALSGELEARTTEFDERLKAIG